MAATEVPFQYERDLRSAAHDAKRTKDHTSKWASGQKHHPGCKVAASPDFVAEYIIKGSNDVHAAKVRPAGRESRYRPKREALNHNRNRESNHLSANYSRPRIEGSFGARDEIRNAAQSKSIIDLLPASSNRGAGVGEDFLYSFDNADSPAPALPLGAFVKTNVRETEKLVEKEYEILDANGEAVRGKKARRTLRQSSSASPETRPQAAAVEDDGFELV